MGVRAESEHHEVETAQTRNRLFVLTAHRFEIRRFHAKRMTVLRLDRSPRQELAAELTPEVALGRRGRAQLVDAHDAHPRELDGPSRLEIPKLLVHQPR